MRDHYDFTDSRPSPYAHLAGDDSVIDDAWLSRHLYVEPLAARWLFGQLQISNIGLEGVYLRALVAAMMPGTAARGGRELNWLRRGVCR